MINLRQSEGGTEGKRFAISKETRKEPGGGDYMFQFINKVKFVLDCVLVNKFNNCS